MFDTPTNAPNDQGPMTITLDTCLDTCYWLLAGKWPISIWPVNIITIVGQSFSSKCSVQQLHWPDFRHWPNWTLVKNLAYAI